MALKVTTQNGAWGTGSTWVGGVAPSSTDSVQIDHAVTAPTGTNTIAGVLVNSSGSLTFVAGTSSKLILNNANFELRGLLTMKPSSVSIVHEIQFINIVESSFVGGGNVILSTDIGLWILAGGRVDLVGATRKPWTNATGSVSAGATSMTVTDATGWQIGDEIFICPTDKPDLTGIDYNDGTNTPIDPYMAKFERKVLTSVAGNTIGWSGGLTYAHNQVSSSIASGTYAASSRTWKAEVGNLTRNVKIGGESITKRTHILFKNTIAAQQNIQYVQFKYMGPRKVDATVHASRPTLVQGRYGVHFHHCDDYTANSLVYGCSMSDVGNRCYVLHNSHNITMSNNVALDFMESALWWDEGHVTHFAKWEDNLLAGKRYNGTGVPAKDVTVQLLKGDGNICRRNVVVYGSQMNIHGNAGFWWEANSEGIWIFEDNLAHSCTSGLGVWQNTSQPHTVVRFDHYNNTEGIAHGAYTNAYEYTGGHGYRSLIFIHATSANSNGVVFKDMYMDAGGEQYCVWVDESPVGSTETGAPHGLPYTTNKIVQCVMKNFDASTGYGVRFGGGGVGGFARDKKLDLIMNDIGNNDGREYDWQPDYGFNDGSWVRLQKISGSNRSSVQTGGVKVDSSGIADFAPRNYGDGILGLKADWYNGANFTDYKVSAFHPLIYFDVWRPSYEINTDGAHHLVTSSIDNGSGSLVNVDYIYSIRWTGRVQPHYTGNHTFTVNGTGQYLMKIDTGSGLTTIIDKWSTSSPDPGPTTSAPISLTAGTKYAIQMDFNNLSSGAQGFALYWKTSQMSTNQLVPQSQLFEPSTNTAPTAQAGTDQVITLPVSSTTLSAIGSTDLDGTIASYAWTRISGPNTPTLGSASARDTTVGATGTALIAGTYVYRVTVTDNLGATATDDVTITVNAANSLPIVNAGADQSHVAPISPVFLTGTATDSDGTIASTVWTKDSGGAVTIVSPTSLSTQVTGLTIGTYTFRLTATDNSGGTAFDQMIVSVTNPVSNVAPTANAGPNRVITLPTTFLTLSGSGYDSDGQVLSQTWSQVSGPNTSTIGTPAAMETLVSGLIAGNYVFRLLVRDNSSAIGTDDVTVTVLDTGSRNVFYIRPKKD